MKKLIEIEGGHIVSNGSDAGMFRKCTRQTELLYIHST